MFLVFFFFFSSRRRHTRLQGDWSSDVCSSDLVWRSERGKRRMPTKTQRAYTLRLSGNATNRELVPDLLWRTHEAVNRGVRTFGDWLLTLRGGMTHELANEPVATRKGDLPPTDAERQDRRLL